MATTSMMIGSVYLAAFTIQVNGNNKNIAAGYYYLRHATASLSLIDTLETAVQTEAAGAVWHLTEGLRARLVPQAAQAVSIDWLSATAVRDLLGYTGNKASDDTPYQATNQSPLWWVPGWLGTPETVLGTAGYVTRDQSTQISADGTTTQTTSYATQVHQEISWTEVEVARMRVAVGTDGGGTFHEFHEQSLGLGYSCRYYQEQTETSGSTTEITWDDTTDNSFGPYVLRRVDPRWYGRVVAYSDLYSPIAIPLMQVDEYS